MEPNEHPAPKPHEYHYFVDGKEYSTEHPSMTGLQIKASANAPANYQLFLEEEGETPDRAISDPETVVLTKKPLHFFAVPPATFG